MTGETECPLPPPAPVRFTLTSVVVLFVRLRRKTSTNLPLSLVTSLLGKNHATCLCRHTSLSIAEIRPSCGRRSKAGREADSVFIGILVEHGVDTCLRTFVNA